MIKKLAFICAALCLSGASAVAVEDNQPVLQVEPGLWSWSHDIMIGQVPIRQTDTECITPDEAMWSLNSLVAELDNGCSLSNVTGAEDDYAFTMTCDGKIPGTAKGRINKDDGQLRLNAQGYADAFGFMAPFTIVAKAERISDCS